MNTNSRDDQDNHNLVMFPSSKNYKIDLSVVEAGSDPLHDLINEFSHLKDEDLPDYLNDESELEQELEETSYHSLDAFMSRNLRGETQTPDDKLIALINDRISAIKDAKARIKFYLDEMEMFLPSRRK